MTRFLGDLFFRALVAIAVVPIAGLIALSLRPGFIAAVIVVVGLVLISMFA